MQRILPMTDVPVGIALLFFVQQFGGSVFTTVGQAILSNVLVSKLTGIPGIDPSYILNEGATNLASIVAPGDMVVVQLAYNAACTRIFLASLGLTFGAFFSALGMEWKSIKKGKNGQDGPSGIGENMEKKMEMSKESDKNNS